MLSFTLSVHVEPLREELCVAQATRDEKFELIRSAVQRQTQPLPAPPVLNPAVAENSKAVANLNSKFNLMEKRTSDAITRLNLLRPNAPAVVAPTGLCLSCTW